MGRIIKLSKIEFYLDYPEDVPHCRFEEIEYIILKNYGKGWRLPALEELIYIRSIVEDFDALKGINRKDDYWTSTEGTPERMRVIVDEDGLPEDSKWFYQVRFIGGFSDYSDEYLCNDTYYGNVLPVRDI
jgi:hypothetical protein